MARILILDEIVVKPGQAAVYRAAYQRDYMPGAQRRGMQLEQSWRNPPLQETDAEIDELPTTFYFLWSVEGVEGWWRMRMSRDENGADERFEKHRWWLQSAQMTLTRKRTFLSDMNLVADMNLVSDLNISGEG